jgi:hypothetical protein
MDEAQDFAGVYFAGVYFAEVGVNLRQQFSRLHIHGS